MADLIDKLKRGVGKGVTTVSVKSKEMLEVSKLKSQVYAGGILHEITGRACQRSSLETEGKIGSRTAIAVLPICHLRHQVNPKLWSRRVEVNMTNRALAVALILMCTGVVFAQEKRPKVAIKTFQNPANYSNSTIGNGLTEILTTELQNTGKFDVLERGNVDELMKEMNFGNTEYAKGATFAQKGNLLGAQYMLMGKVTNFSYSEQQTVEQSQPLFGPRRSNLVYLQRADVRVDFRLIDVSTGETVLSQAGEAHNSNKSQVSENDAWRRCILGSITSELTSSLIGRTTAEAIKDIVRKLSALSTTVRERGTGEVLNASLEKLGGAKGQLLADEGGGLWIVGGVGNATGLRKGDRLQVTHENLIKDKSGKVVYRKPVHLGYMEVTDVSEADHAEARFVANQAGGGSPQANDLVSVDVDYARSLRGGAAAPSPATALPPAGTGTTAAGNAGPRADEFIKRAESYMSDKFYSQALDQYNQAAAIDPNDPRALRGQAMAHYMMEDFVEGDASAEKLLQTGSELSVPIAHHHTLGICTGQLVIQKGKLAYKSDKSDGFEVTAADLSGVEVRNLPRPRIMVKEPEPNWPVLEIRIRDPKGKERKYDMLAVAYSKQQNPNGRNLASAFPMDESDLADLQKFENSMLNLIQKYVK